MSGEWRTVWVTGTVRAAQLPVLEGWVPPINGERTWIAPRMDVLGIMYGELARIVDGFAWIVAAAPSFTASVHISPTYSDRTVERTVTIANGTVVVGAAGVEQLRPETKAEAAARVMSDWESSSDAMHRS